VKVLLDTHAFLWWISSDRRIARCGVDRVW
jgi:PIN domain nuclease of toxin-antitoxin system